MALTATSRATAVQSSPRRQLTDQDLAEAAVRGFSRNKPSLNSKVAKWIAGDQLPELIAVQLGRSTGRYFEVFKTVNGRPESVGYGVFKDGNVPDRPFGAMLKIVDKHGDLLMQTEWGRQYQR